MYGLRHTISLALLFAPLAIAQITTIAGSPPADGTPPLEVTVRSIQGVAVDAAGNIYASSIDFNIIYKLDPQNHLAVFAGTGASGFSGDGGPAKQAEMYSPRGLAVGPDNALYVADSGNHRIRRVDLNTNVITTIAGTGQASFTGNGGFPAIDSALNTPYSVDVDQAGNVFAACYQNNRIVKIEKATGILRVVAGNGGFEPVSGNIATSTAVPYPGDVKVDDLGNFFFANWSTNLVRKATSSGALSIIAGGGDQYPGDGSAATSVRLYPTAIAVDKAGTVIVSAREGTFQVKNNILQRISSESSYAIRHDAAGNLLMGIPYSLRLLRPNTSVAERILGNNSTICADAPNAQHVCVDPNTLLWAGDRLLVADDQRLRMITAEGSIRTLVDNISGSPFVSLGASRTAFYYLSGTTIRRIDRTSGFNTPVVDGAITFAVDEDNTIFYLRAVSATTNQLIRRLPNGTETTFPQSYPGGHLLWLRPKLYFSTAPGGISTINSAGSAAKISNALSLRALGADTFGNLYYPDLNSISRLEALTNIVTPFATSETLGTGKFPAIYGLAVSPTGTVFISESSNHRIRAIGNPCIYSLSRTSFSAPPEGDSGRILVTTTPLCQWTATSDASWLTITNPPSGKGRGDAIFQASPNTTPQPRFAILTIAGTQVTVTQAASACTYTFASPSLTIESTGMPVSVNVITPDGCDRTSATVPPWIEITSLNPFTLRAIPNPGPIPRAGFLTIGGQTLPILQKPDIVASPFTDVAAFDAFSDFIAVLRHYNVTQGCTTSSYCPNEPVTRGQMAAFLTRALFGADDLPTPTLQSFTDVSASHPFFRHIQKLRETGITQGCTTTTYCPDIPVTRAQMAAFLTRATTGSDTFPFPAAPSFTDVPANHPFFRYIQKLRQFGITQGCTATTYCPDASVTRGQMAAFLVRGFPR